MGISTEKIMRGAATVSDPRWNAVVARDRSADGTFFYSVKTTGVYCRPSCASRKAKPENVQFHLTAEEAERAGFRPCHRCNPDSPSQAEARVATVAEACRYIEASETVPSLQELARVSGLSAYHLHRIFKSLTGVTPTQYAAAHRARRMRGSLKTSASITAAIYEAGYNSNSRFYEKSNGILGMTPSTFRAGGAGIQIEYAIGPSTLGTVLVAQTEKGICAILFGDNQDQLIGDLQRHFPRATLAQASGRFADTLTHVIKLIDCPGTPFSLPLDIRGTAFQCRVWQALQSIPAGSTTTYASVAKMIGQPTAVRAVARACASNHIAVAVPCHRVVSSDGKISGYRWGVERKRKLLDREAQG